jgi:hypothetical protein
MYQYLQKKLSSQFELIQFFLFYCYSIARNSGNIFEATLRQISNWCDMIIQNKTKNSIENIRIGFEAVKKGDFFRS